MNETDLTIYQHRVKAIELLVSAVKRVVVERHVLRLGDRAYVRVAGGTAIANAMGLTVREASCEYVPEGTQPAHWHAIAEVVDERGQIVGRGSGRVFSDEPRWQQAERFACAAMAGTRAAARALRYVLGHVYVAMELADTPAEEMEAITPRDFIDVPARVVPPPPPTKSLPTGPVTATVTAVESKDGITNGRPWTKYKITLGDLGPAYTFDSKVAGLAEEALAQSLGVEVTLALSKRGQSVDLKSFRIVEQAMEEVDPARAGIPF